LVSYEQPSQTPLAGRRKPRHSSISNSKIQFDNQQVAPTVSIICVLSGQRVQVVAPKVSTQGDKNAVNIISQFLLNKVVNPMISRFNPK
jgi:hypothetical protein